MPTPPEILEDFESSILAIDPGTKESGYVTWNGKNILSFGKISNCLLWDIVFIQNHPVVIEEINPYTMGMAIRDTILWSGQFEGAVKARCGQCYYIPRREVRKHLCDSGGPKITDSVITQALVDRFAYGQKNYGKGTKKEPGFFYGFKQDVWQAFALAVTWWDINKGRDKNV